MIRLYNGDCLRILKDISSNSVDCIICDLPFGCLSAKPISEEKEQQYGKGRLTTYMESEWDVPLNLDDFWKEIKRVRKNDHTPTLHFCTTRYGFELYASNPKEFRYDLVWSKERGVSFLSVNKMPLRSHEMVYVFSKSGSYYNRVDISGNYKGWETKAGGTQRSQTYHSVDGSPKDADGFYHIPKLSKKGGEGVRSVLSVIPQKQVIKTGKHPTEKPVDLYKWLLQRYCPAGGTVLDPTFGSCNSGVASKALGLNYIGIEKNKDFFDKGKEKLQQNAPTPPG